MTDTDFTSALMAGGMAGTVVDLVLFPLDTIKTRLQSSQGFLRAGGFRKIYSGVVPVALGSAPGAALFFATYEFIKNIGNLSTSPQNLPLVHMAAASLGEVVACLIRVPVEVVKQRSQASSQSSWLVLKKTLEMESMRGLYRGYWSTIIREVPFSLVQFPTWEFLKMIWSRHQDRSVDSWQSAICGALAGATAASVTTPLDVVKTRIMLSEKGTTTAQGHVIRVLREVWIDKGFRGLFSGMLPRCAWISFGGAIFLGTYEKLNDTFKLWRKQNIGSR